ncbi:MAG: S41 family peptidase [Bacteroidales bacterium]|nr:S41 family peptidase [Bacteroidales bacterium]
MNHKNTKRNIYLPLLLSVFLVGGILIGLQFSNNQTGKSISIHPRVDKLHSIINYIGSEYVDTVSKSKLVEAAIPAMLKELDPHSVYIPARDFNRINEPLEGNFDGIGIEFNMPEDTVVVMNTIPGGPSDKVGIIPGDRLITVNDSIIAGVNMPTEQVIKRLKGPRGSEVNVIVKRNGLSELLEFEIIRDAIPLYSVDVAMMINDNTGYIKINKFSRTTFEEFLEGINKLKNKGLQKLIVDLRANGGGYMDAATNIADQFLEKGTLIVFTQGRARPRNEITATDKGAFLTGDIVFLIDEWSASASEILAGAIQDNDRGTIIGRRSFGKGLVQEPMMFSDGSAMRLTIARYYTPTGRCIQKPYNNGSDEYYSDLNERFENGEFAEKDSIHFSDSLKYYTPEGKLVFGGGGIMPDIFIPIDTSYVTGYFMKIRAKGLIYRFTFDYSDKNRQELEKFENYKSLIHYLDQIGVYEKFIKYAGENNVKENPVDLLISGDIIKTQLFAYIARNFFDNEGFYSVYAKSDRTLQKAIEFLGK